MDLPAPKGTRHLRRATTGLTWAAFVAGILDRLPLDNKRRNLETFLQAAIKDGVRDLQRYVPQYKKGFRLHVKPENLTANGKAQSLWLPREGKLRGVIARNQVQDFELQLAAIAYEDYTRLVLTDGWDDEEGVALRTERHPGFYAVDPEGDRLHFAPALSSEELLVVLYDEISTDYADADELPWGEDAIRVTASYVKARVKGEVDDDLSAHNALMQIYRQGARALYLEERRKRDTSAPNHLPEINYDTLGYETYHDADGNPYLYSAPAKSSF